ncbi:hypothetical protein [Engelhardtia mirabilis]
MRTAFVTVLALVFAAWPWRLAPAHQEASDGGVATEQAELESKLDRFVDLAMNGAPAVRPQAADRLTRMGAAAAERLLAECGEGPADMAHLGTDLVEVLARFDEPRLRAKLWEAAADADFPWRPAAARSLAITPLEREREGFLDLTQDRLAAVRVAALSAVGTWEGDAGERPLTEALRDEDDRVRRAAAEQLYARGATWVLRYPLEELSRADHFFDIDTGRIARFQAARVLRGVLGDLDGYQPQLPPDDPTNLAAIATITERVRALIDGPARELPAVARVGEPVPAGTIGLELRSCRAGELFLQWGPGDVLYVGLGNPRRVSLADGHLDELAPIAEAAALQLGDARVFGEPGCDLECLRVTRADGTVETIYMRKGPEARPDLRPAALDGLMRALLGGLPPGEEALARRLRDALTAVGGPPDDSDGLSDD